MATQWQNAQTAVRNAPQGGGSWLSDAASWAGRKLFGDNRERDASMDPQNFQLQGADYLRGYAQQQLDGVQGRTAPQIGSTQLDARAQVEARMRMQQLADQYGAVAAGTAKGAGEMAVDRQAQQAAAQQFAMANAARGSNAGIMARAASRQLGDMGVNAAGMAAQSALQDQAAARQGLGGLLSGMRGQDLDLASQNAQLLQQRNLANQAASLQQRGMNDQYGLGLLGQYADVSGRELAARTQRAMGLNAQPRDRGLFGDALQAGGSILTAYAGNAGK